MNLTQEKETLFVPLLGKAEESRRPNPILSDPKAEEIIKTVDYDFSKLRVPIQSRTTLAMRAKKLDDIVRAYLTSAPASPLVLHLGCGLDSRILRVGSPSVPWYDLDYPAVIELRRQFYAETETYHMLGSSVTDYSWIDAVEPRLTPPSPPVPGGPWPPERSGVGEGGRGDDHGPRSEAEREGGWPSRANALLMAPMPTAGRRNTTGCAAMVWPRLAAGVLRKAGARPPRSHSSRKA